MYYQRFATGLADIYVASEYFFLYLKRSAAQGVQTGFANGHHIVEGGGFCKPDEVGFGGRVSIPRMYACAVVSRYGHGRQAGQAYHGILPGVGAVGVYVGEVGDRFHGTGSYPLPPQGWQRHMRRMLSHSPFTAPCLRNASMAYWLHVGVKRQLGGNSGDMHARYSNTGSVSSHAAALLSGFSGLAGIGEGFKEPAHGFLYATVRLQRIVEIEECQVVAHAIGQREQMSVQTICLAHATAHLHAVDSMVQPLLGHGYQELYRGIGVSSGVRSPYGT